MTRDDMLTEMLAMRARLDAMIDAIKSEHAEPQRPTNEPRWLRISQFCKR